ncbi:hypothetical protein OIE50_50570 [Streptomyces canus]|uniref:hypothetical protein n=1 Tax=Streptomyces canus TaxID=58343 RepID=UPI00324D90FF
MTTVQPDGSWPWLGQTVPYPRARSHYPDKPVLTAGAALGTGRFEAYCLTSDGRRTDYLAAPFKVTGDAPVFAISSTSARPGKPITFAPLASSRCPAGTKQAWAGLGRKLSDFESEGIAYPLTLDSATGAWKARTITVDWDFQARWYTAVVSCVLRVAPDGSNELVSNYANVVLTGVPPLGGSLYYSPYDGPVIKYPGDPDGVRAPAPATLTLDRKVWTSRTPACSASKAVPADSLLYGKNGKQLTTLAGWSAGRLGPVYFLSSKSPWAAMVSHILLIDPGSDDYKDASSCDAKYDQSRLYANWLARSPDNRLTILAGDLTAHCRRGTCDFEGLKKKVFPRIISHPKVGNRSIRNQVTVCYYAKLRHEDAWLQLRGTVNAAPPTPTTCPAVRGYTVRGWHP